MLLRKLTSIGTNSVLNSTHILLNSYYFNDPLHAHEMSMFSFISSRREYKEQKNKVCTPLRLTILAEFYHIHFHFMLIHSLTLYSHCCICLTTILPYAYVCVLVSKFTFSAAMTKSIRKTRAWCGISCLQSQHEKTWGRRIAIISSPLWDTYQIETNLDYEWIPVWKKKLEK